MKTKIITTLAIGILLFLNSTMFSAHSNQLKDSCAGDDTNISITNSVNEMFADEPVTFTNVTSLVGLSGVSAFTFSWGDYNNDGYEDLLISNRLFRNNGPPIWNFTEVSVPAGLSTSPGPGVWGDYDNDGDLDIYAVAGWPQWDVLWRNNGDGTFTNVTAAAGNVYDRLPSAAAAWGDYDNDGYIDLYVANYEISTAVGTQDRLYHNNGDGTFTDVTGLAILIPEKCGRGVAWADYDNDGDLDIYVSNYRLEANNLWQNNNGVFKDVASQAGVAGVGQDANGNIPGPYHGHTIGSSWSDFDNDGNLDLFCANLAHKDVGAGTPNRGLFCDDSYLFRNNGRVSNYNFTDVRASSGIPIHPPGSVHPSGYFYDELFSGCAWGDYDNDGDLDLWIPQVYGNLEFGHSFLYRQDGVGSGHFTDVSTQVGDGITCSEVRVWGGYAGAWCDYNNDGFLDLITCGAYPYGGTTEIRLFKNNGNANNWLQLKLGGRTSNKAAIGARVEVTAGNLVQIREVEGGTGSHSHQNSLPLEFGFGTFAGKVNITIRWAPGKMQTLRDVSLNQILTVTEPDWFEIPLNPGWNLISIPFNGSSTIEDLLKPISGKYDYVQYYDAADTNDHWKVYAVNKPDYLNDLNKINPTMGVWLYINSPNVVLGVPISAIPTTAINLVAGWNLVGYPTFTNKTVKEALSKIPWEKLQTYGGSSKYLLRDMAENEFLKPGCGYWIKASRNCSWLIDW